MSVSASSASKCPSCCSGKDSRISRIVRSGCRSSGRRGGSGMFGAVLMIGSSTKRSAGPYLGTSLEWPAIKQAGSGRTPTSPVSVLVSFAPVRPRPDGTTLSTPPQVRTPTTPAGPLYGHVESVWGATPHEFASRILRQCLTGHDVEGPRCSRWGPSTCPGLGPRLARLRHSRHFVRRAMIARPLWVRGATTRRPTRLHALPHPQRQSTQADDLAYAHAEERRRHSPRKAGTPDIHRDIFDGTGDIRRDAP